ncbi:hypothetical protein B566_EDAN004274 [Ephemera danica]|nr:hypothetical protein B566_EDAN004274 [Ephemera danica]
MLLPVTLRECPGTLRVHLTVSPLVDGLVRQLELYWTGATPQPGDWVGLFSSDPAGAVPLPPSLAVVDPAGNCEGWERTVITEQGRVNNSIQLGFQPRCLDYYVGYIRGNTTLASSCLRLEPTWMTERPALGAFPLTNLFLPGSHDSGAYGEFDPDIGDNSVTKYTVCQDEDILSQLIRGIRYLDIRVAYYRYLALLSNESDSGFWLNHGAFRMFPMEIITEQVRQFLLNTPSQEIVIFDVQEFSFGFNGPEDHDRLVNFFANEFAGLILHRNATTNGLQANPPNNGRPWSAMAELTPSTFDVITDRLGGLRPMADSVNRNVTTWYLGSWGETVNIVACDFFRGTDIVAVALEWDDKRVQARKAKEAQRSSWYSRILGGN